MSRESILTHVDKGYVVYVQEYGNNPLILLDVFNRKQCGVISFNLFLKLKEERYFEEIIANRKGFRCYILKTPHIFVNI